MTKFTVNGSVMCIPLEDFEIAEDIYIELNGRVVDFSKDAIGALRSSMNLSAFYRCSLTDKNDIFGILKLFSDHIIPGVANFLKKNNVTLGDSIYTEQMYICFHYYNVASTVRQLATTRNHQIAGSFNNIIDKIIQETFKKSDIEKIENVYEYFDTKFDKKITNISLVVTRFIDNIISGYIPAEHIHIAPTRLYGHLHNIAVNKINPLRITHECITDILSDDDQMIFGEI